MANIICPNCGKENREGSRFCGECGTMLDVDPMEFSDDFDKLTDEAEQEADEEEPEKAGFFRGPMGKIVIIVIIAAVVVIALVAVMLLRPNQTEEQETLEEIVAAEEDDSYAEEDDFYILPDSDIRYYTEDELCDFTDEQLRLARNEIYARHGRVFDSEDLRDYFESQPWYEGTIEPGEFSDSMLNEYELANISLIQSLENASGYMDGTNAIIAVLSVGQTYSCDLDGDGINETVSLKNDNGQYEENMDYMVSLLVNGETCATIETVWSEVGYIVDIDSSDGTLQIGVQCSEEDDYVGTYFYSYDSEGLHLLKNIPGSFYLDSEYPNIICTGDGTIQSYKLLSVFETWFASATWMFKDGQLVELVPNVYEPLDLFNGLGIDLTVRERIKVSMNDPYSGDYITLPVGTKVHMTGTDNRNWVSMTADGYEGMLYLWLDDGQYIFLEDSVETAPSSYVFDNTSIWG